MSRAFDTISRAIKVATCEQVVQMTYCEVYRSKMSTYRMWLKLGREASSSSEMLLAGRRGTLASKASSVS